MSLLDNLKDSFNGMMGKHVDAAPVEAKVEEVAPQIVEEKKEEDEAVLVPSESAEEVAPQVDAAIDTGAVVDAPVDAGFGGDVSN